MIDPIPKQVILDPACGTGGFLITAMNQVIAKLREAERRKWKNPESPSERESAELFRKIQDYANSNIIGMDLNPNLVKASKMNMVMNNEVQAASIKLIHWTGL
jgi:type I restriction enzyme M protein